MAIRLEHQPIGIAGLAAYAAGAGRRKERDRKYVTDLLQNQQDRADKYNLLANQQQFIIERDRERAGVERAQAQRANEFHIGEINLANMQAKEADELDFKRGEFRDRRDYARSVLAKLPPIPADAPVVVRKMLEESRTAISKLATSEFDLADPDAGAAFDEAVKSYNAGLAAIPKPSRAKKVNDDTVYRDPSGTAYDEPGAGRTPYSVSTGKPVFDPVDPVETVPFNGQQVPVKMYQDHVKGVVESQKQWDQGFGSAVTPEEQKAFERRVGPRPQSPPSVLDLRYPEQPQAPAAQANAADPLAFLGELKPQRLPPEFPPGTIPLPDGTMEYNGQIYRRRAQSPAAQANAAPAQVTGRPESDSDARSRIEREILAESVQPQIDPATARDDFNRLPPEEEKRIGRAAARQDWLPSPESPRDPFDFLRNLKPQRRRQ